MSALAGGGGGVDIDARPGVCMGDIISSYLGVCGTLVMPTGGPPGTDGKLVVSRSSSCTTS